MNENSPKGPKGLVGFLLTAVAGAVLTAAGLAWDAMLHAADPDLAAREGVFTLSNPGHLLAGIGMALAGIGISGAAFVTLFPTSRGTGRRRLVIAGVVAAVVMTAGSIALAATADPESHSHAVAETDSTEGHVDTAHEGQHSRIADVASATEEERKQAEDLLEAVISSTAKYRDVEVARADGYRVDPDRPGTGLFLHSPSPRNQLDGITLDAARPESLIYSELPDGQLVLVGALFKRERGDESADVGGPITQWHYHSNCIDPLDRMKLAKPNDGVCPEGTRLSSGRAEMMHVWFTNSIKTAFAERAPVSEMVEYQQGLGVSIDISATMRARRGQRMMQPGS